MSMPSTRPLTWLAETADLEVCERATDPLSDDLDLTRCRQEVLPDLKLKVDHAVLRSMTIDRVDEAVSTGVWLVQRNLEALVGEVPREAPRDRLIGVE